jgi:hypothetical protein
LHVYPEAQITDEVLSLYAIKLFENWYE